MARKIRINNIGSTTAGGKVWSVNIRTDESKRYKKPEIMYLKTVGNSGDVIQNITGFTSKEMWDLYNAIHEKLAELT